ncbi:MAG: outer membrane beta-barrel protein [Bacteroidetes bacterium]|nr:outer membrane beta-barrel protein [Bacteroidota bacterium]
MQDPKFEKQVQQKMEELQFTPSDAVWKKVEAGLDKEKKRRVPIFWLFLLGGLLLTGGVYFVSTSGDTKKIISAEEKSRYNQQKENKNHVVASGNKDQIKREKNTVSTEIQSKEKNLPVKTANENLQQANHTRQITSVRKEDVAVPSAYTKTKNEISSSKEKKQPNERREESVNNDNITNTPEKNENQSPPAAAKKEIRKDVNEHSIDATNDTSSSKIPATDVANKKNEAAVNKKVTKSDSTAGNKIVKSNKQKKKSSSWQVGLAANPGISNISQGLFKTGYAGSAATLNAYVPLTPLAYYNNSPSTIRAGFSFGAGVFVRKKISDRIKISAGLNYHYYSTHITVGQYVDTARLIYTTATNASYLAGGYYQGNKNLSSYTNHYHFAEVPVLLGIQLNNSRSKLPVIWETGLSLSYLINTNALQYDEYSGVYYKNNSFFNRMQLSASTGLMFGFHVKKNVIEVGPQVQYGLMHLLNKNAANPEHMLFGGMKLVFVRSEK